MPDPASEPLRSIVDTLLPASPASPAGRAYPSGSAAGTDGGVAELVRGLAAVHRKEFASLLRAVESPLTNLLLSGRPIRFSRLDPAEREKFLRSWATSRLTVKRKGFQAAKRLAVGLYYSGPVGERGHPL